MTPIGRAVVPLLSAIRSGLPAPVKLSKPLIFAIDRFGLRLEIAAFSHDPPGGRSELPAKLR